MDGKTEPMQTLANLFITFYSLFQYCNTCRVICTKWLVHRILSLTLHAPSDALTYLKLERLVCCIYTPHTKQCTDIQKTLMACLSYFIVHIRAHAMLQCIILQLTSVGRAQACPNNIYVLISNCAPTG